MFKNKSMVEYEYIDKLGLLSNYGEKGRREKNIILLLQNYVTLNVKLWLIVKTNGTEK